MILCIKQINKEPIFGINFKKFNFFKKIIIKLYLFSVKFLKIHSIFSFIFKNHQTRKIQQRKKKSEKEYSQIQKKKKEIKDQLNQGKGITCSSFCIFAFIFLI